MRGEIQVVPDSMVLVAVIVPAGDLMSSLRGTSRHRGTHDSKKGTFNFFGQ